MDGVSFKAAFKSDREKKAVVVYIFCKRSKDNRNPFFISFLVSILTREQSSNGKYCSQLAQKFFFCSSTDFFPVVLILNVNLYMFAFRYGFFFVFSDDFR